MLQRSSKFLVLITATLALSTTVALAASDWLDKYAAEPDGEPVEIGLLAPLTGTQGVFGEDMVAAAEMAVDETNASGGVLGRPLELKIEDTETRPSPAMDAARKLVGVDGLKVLTGGFSSGVSMPVAAYAQDNEILYLLAVPTSPKFRDAGDFVMSVTVLDTFKGKALAEFIDADSDAQTFALAFMNNDFGQQLRKVTKKRLEELGKEVVTEVNYQLNKVDYQPEITRLYSQDPDAIVASFYAHEGLIWAKQAYKLDRFDMEATPWYIGEVTTSFSDALKSYPDILDGVKGLDPLEPKELFTTKFEQRTGHKPVTPFAAQYYDAVRMLAMAMNFANSTDAEDVRDSLFQIASWYRGMSYGGDKRFDEDGMQAHAAFRKVLIKDGEIVGYDEP